MKEQVVSPVFAYTTANWPNPKSSPAKEVGEGCKCGGSCGTSADTAVSAVSAEAKVGKEYSSYVLPFNGGLTTITTHNAYMAEPTKEWVPTPENSTLSETKSELERVSSNVMMLASSLCKNALNHILLLEGKANQALEELDKVAKLNLELQSEITELNYAIECLREELDERRSELGELHCLVDEVEEHVELDDRYVRTQVAATILNGLLSKANTEYGNDFIILRTVGLTDQLLERLEETA